MTASSYGADDNGLVCGYLFTPNEPGRALTAEEALAWLADEGRPAPGSFAWFHFNLSHAAAEPWLEANIRLPQDFWDALHQGSRSTRIERDRESRRTSDEFGVVLRDIATLQERIKLLQEKAASRVAEENNRSIFLLTMVTVLALPINLVAGLLGMNVGGVPLTRHPHGFWWIVAMVAGLPRCWVPMHSGAWTRGGSDDQ